MTRHALNFLAAVSLLLCVAACALWVRSYSQRHVVKWTLTNLGEPPDPTYQHPRYHESRMIEFASGGVQLDRWRIEAAVIGTGGSGGPLESGFEYYSTRHPFYPLRQHPELLNGAQIWTLGGLQVCTASEGFTRGGYSEQSVTVPMWLLVIASGVLPAAWLRKRMRRSGHHGLCASCGYDLRATPGRCPECGTQVSGTPTA
jgi:hypothetical protein